MIEYAPATTATDQATVEGFVEVYKEAFGGPPYFESYSTEEVLSDIWRPHIDDGIVMLATYTSQVVGFGCAIPLPKAPEDIREYMEGMTADTLDEADLERLWYMSELGVLKTFRKQGIAYNLVKHRLRAIKDCGGTHYFLRTAAEGSNSVHMYEKIGAERLPENQDISESDQVTINDSQSTRRIYLLGECATGLSLIPD